MDIAIHTEQGICNARMSGKFTFNDHMAFRDILLQMEQEDIRQVVLHMEQVEFVDSAALGMLLLANDQAQKHQKQLVISGVSGQVKKMFDMARFNVLFTMID